MSILITNEYDETLKPTAFRGKPPLRLVDAHARGHEDAPQLIDVVGLGGVDAPPDVPGVGDEMLLITPGDGELDGVAGVPEVRGEREAAAEQQARVALGGVGGEGGLLHGVPDGGDGGRVGRRHARGRVRHGRGGLAGRGGHGREGLGHEGREVGAHKALQLREQEGDQERPPQRLLEGPVVVERAGGGERVQGDVARRVGGAAVALVVLGLVAHEGHERHGRVAERRDGLLGQRAGRAGRGVVEEEHDLVQDERVRARHQVRRARRRRDRRRHELLVAQL